MTTTGHRPVALHCAEPANSRTHPGTGTLSASLTVRFGDWTHFEPVQPLVNACTAALAALTSLPSPICEAAIALDDDDAVRTLNHTYRHQDKPTNVLSFPAGPSGLLAVNFGEPAFLGDIVLAAETLAKEAADLGIPPAHHFQHLIVHGLLHLLGYDHEDDTSAAEMESLETAILARLSIPDPYKTPIPEARPVAGSTG